MTPHELFVQIIDPQKPERLTFMTTLVDPVELIIQDATEWDLVPQKTPVEIPIETVIDNTSNWRERMPTEQRLAMIKSYIEQGGQPKQPAQPVQPVQATQPAPVAPSGPSQPTPETFNEFTDPVSNARYRVSNTGYVSQLVWKPIDESDGEFIAIDDSDTEVETVTIMVAKWIPQSEVDMEKHKIYEDK